MNTDGCFIVALNRIFRSDSKTVVGINNKIENPKEDKAKNRLRFDSS